MLITFIVQKKQEKVKDASTFQGHMVFWLVHL